MLTPGGTLYLIDEHPLAWHFLCPGARPSYFCTEPQRHEREGDYCDRTFRHEHPVVEYQHTVAELVNSVIDAGLRVGRLEEYDFGFFQVFEDWVPMEGGYRRPAEGRTIYPLMLSLKATKP